MKIICIVGADGSGKSTLAKAVVEQLAQRGHRPVLLWSRYNHLFSRPLLAVARLMGRSPRERHDGAVFGYHYFGVWYLKWPFIMLQCLDVNIALRWQMWKARKRGDVLVFERSPWDTLADVMLDVSEREMGRGRTPDASGVPSSAFRAGGGCGRAALNASCSGVARWMVSSVKDSQVFWIARSQGNIVKSRPSMKHDKDLALKLALYEHLCLSFGWTKIANDGALADAQERLIGNLD